MKRRKADAPTIVAFVGEHYAELASLYRITAGGEYASDVVFREATRGLSDLQRQRLIEYGLVLEREEGYALAEGLRAFVELIDVPMRPLLREQLGKRLDALRHLYHRLLDGNPEVETRLEVLDAINRETEGFLDDVAAHTAALHFRMKELRDQRGRFGDDYIARAREARRLVKVFVEPSLLLLDPADERSARKVFAAIGEQTGRDRLDATYVPRVQRRSELTYRIVSTVMRHVVAYATAITRELLPMLRRIQQESELLAGFTQLLEAGRGAAGPSLVGRHKRRRYSRFSAHAAQRVADNVRKSRQPVQIELTPESAEVMPLPIPTEELRGRLRRDLPIADYYAWCATLAEVLTATQSATEADARERLFLRLMSLPPREGDALLWDYGDSEVDIAFAKTRYRAPVLSLSARE